MQTGTFKEAANSFDRKRLSTALQPLVVLAALLVGLLLQFVTLKAPANFYDEGLVLLNTSRILDGEVPYRDFWSLYAPGYFYMLAGVFKVFGSSILIARIFDTLVRFLVTVAVYVFARRMVSWWAALIPYALVSLWLAAVRFYVYPAFPALGTIFLTLICLARYMETRQQRWLFFAGLGLGLTTALRLDFGGYATVGTGLALLVYEVWLARANARAFKPALLAALRSELLLAGGLAVITLPLFGSLAVASGLGTLWTDLVSFPATTFRAVRHLPLPSLLPDIASYSDENWEDWFRLYLPLGIFTACLVNAAWMLRRSQNGTSDRQGFTAALFIALSITGFGLVIKASSRYHDLHALPAAFLAVTALTALFSRVPARTWRRWPFVVVLVVFILLAVRRPYVTHFTRMFEEVSAYRWDGCYSTLELAGCVPVPPDQQAAVEYIQRVTQPDEFILVANARHDQIFVNDLLFYYLADRRSATPYAELHPGLATTREVQQAIAADLLAKDVRWVVVSQGYTSNEPNASSISSHINDLDEFIRENYSLVTANNSYHILSR